MIVQFKDVINPNELFALASVVQIGDALYHELMDTRSDIFSHPYMADMKGRIRTKLVQMQCEIESQNSKFPFEFSERKFRFNHVIPELRNKHIILHFGRSSSPGSLPRESKYKIKMSNNNHLLQRQMVIDLDKTPPFGDEPFYAILAFGGFDQPFSVIQFPEPGYNGIAECLPLKQVNLADNGVSAKAIERKKAVLKKEFLARGIEGIVS